MILRKSAGSAAAVADQFGRADILVNSAGFTRMVPHADLEALDDDLIDAVLKANVRGPFATIRAFAPLLRTSGNGLIVNISSGAAARGGGSSIIYGASKAALDTMSMALARVLAPEIRVIVIAPGMVHTGFVPGRTEEMMAAAAAATPLKRAVEADDVAKAVMACVAFLTHTTGSTAVLFCRRTERSSELRFLGVTNSPLDGDGFEPSVPVRERFSRLPCLSSPSGCCERDRGFEALFLDRRVWLRKF